MKLRKIDPWKPAIDYSRELSGLTVNLLVNNISKATEFSANVIEAKIIYQDIDFAAIEGFGSKWCFHADHTYDKHPLASFINKKQKRGNGIELRLLGCNPDKAEMRAKKYGFKVISKSQDKPHGLRECYIIDSAGYCWVPCEKI
ncbi:hypothetical protein OAS23_00555 [Alphaproteobacteria bacterium]|nr:hypothetical protein [Alphaproteobacteria bacterium]